ncbi:MAG: EpsG family protein [Paracoccaceae bacterium]
MLPYWLFFLLPAMMAIEGNPRWRLRRDGTRSVKIDASWFAVLIFLTVIIGWRYDVGGDWSNYFRFLFYAERLDYFSALFQDDPGYWILNVLAVRNGWGIAGVNVISGFFFAAGLVVFCRSLPRPWLALAVAMPYMVTVVAMGYTRQAVALGFAMMGLVALGRKNVFFFVLWVVIGATFHKSAVLLIPLAAFTIAKNRFFIGGLVLVTAGLAYEVLLSEAAAGLVATYQDENIASAGALIRLSMNVMPAALFMIYRRSFVMPEGEFKLWRIFSVLALASFAAYFTLPMSTALDRMGLYLIPLQLVVFSHLPDVMGKFGRKNQSFVILIVGYYALVLFTWLVFANNSRWWIPYQIQFWQ